MFRGYIARCESGIHCYYYTSMKYILISGSIASGIGKGITCSSVASLLQSRGLIVTAVKIDGYLNQDSGLISPGEHGECAVLDSGAECDLDLLNYERFLDINLTGKHSITSGKIYSSVLSKERAGIYLGATVTMIPHVTDEIQAQIQQAVELPINGEAPQITMIELGGLIISDLEVGVFVEALRQLRYRVGEQQFYHIHVSYAPFLGESKSKPVQNAAKELWRLGLPADLIVCRSPQPVSPEVIAKIAAVAMLPLQNILDLHDVSNIYHVPERLETQDVCEKICKKLQLHNGIVFPETIQLWKKFARVLDDRSLRQVRIGIVGKYTALPDSYLSILRAFDHVAVALNVRIEIVWINSEEITEGNVYRKLELLHGILIPGGFSVRGTEGMILAAQFARLLDIPLLGICLGFQIMAIEIARNMLRLKDATSEEFDAESKNNIIYHIRGISRDTMGGNMKLGSHRTLLLPDSLASRIYRGVASIIERHRHRYEINWDRYGERMKSVGLIASGIAESQDKLQRVDCIELPLRFYFGIQFHAEMQSRPSKPSPPFTAFVKSMLAGAD